MVACNATTIISVWRRPYSSDKEPLDRLPMAAPAKKHISITCKSVESSQTTFHSDWIVVSLISLSNTKRVHFSNSIVSLGDGVNESYCSSILVRFFAIVQAPFGWESRRHSDVDKFVAGTAHQNSRSTAYLLFYWIFYLFICLNFEKDL